MDSLPPIKIFNVKLFEKRCSNSENMKKKFHNLQTRLELKLISLDWTVAEELSIFLRYWTI